MAIKASVSFTMGDTLAFPICKSFWIIRPVIQVWIVL